MSDTKKIVLDAFQSRLAARLAEEETSRAVRNALHELVVEAVLSALRGLCGRTGLSVAVDRTVDVGVWRVRFEARVPGRCAKAFSYLIDEADGADGVALLVSRIGRWAAPYVETDGEGK